MPGPSLWHGVEQATVLVNSLDEASLLRSGRGFIGMDGSCAVLFALSAREGALTCILQPKYILYMDYVQTSTSGICI